jgi:hypothetical protein
MPFAAFGSIAGCDRLKDGNVMSIYTARAKRAPDTEQQPEQTRGARPDPAPAGAVPFATPVQVPTRLRKATPIESLLPASVLWLKSLPPEVQPNALIAKYGRIVNLLAQQWNDYNACSAYFDDLLVGRRGNRRGFPPEVHQDLRKLREHFQRVRLKSGGLTVL